MQVNAIKGILLALAVAVGGVVEGKKVLLIGFPFTSHMNELMTVSKELMKRGHEVFAVMDVNKLHEARFQGTNIKFLTYDSLDKEQTEIKMVEERWQELGFSNPRLSMPAMMQELSVVLQPLGTRECKMIIGDERLLRQIRQEKFDLAILDSIYYCSYLIPHKLNIPYASMGTFVHMWKHRMHPVGSAFPCNIESDNSFINRFMQFFVGIIVENSVADIFLDQSAVLNYGQEKPYGSLPELVANSSLFIINQNVLGSCPAPSMPNVIYAGGLTNKPAKPLNEEYASIVQNAQDGVIIMSFGSGMTNMPKDFVKKFLSAFGKLKHVVIWRLQTTYDLDVPANVRIVDWMPQNDLLGHSKAKMFITHCGNNGQYEALYHGVPMIGCPLFGDQDNNCQRMEYKGFGLQINSATFTAEELLRKIQEVMGNPKYLASIKRASAIHRSLPDPIETSVFWLEHVMEYGGKHLRPALNDMNVAQFLMLDIFAVVLVLILVLTGIIMLLLSCIYRRLLRSSDSLSAKRKTN